MEQNHKRKRSRSKRSKSIERNTYKSKKIGVGIERYSSGIGYIILPGDIDRESYIKFSYQTYTVMIITTTGEIISDVLVPEHILREIKFPEGSEDRGSIVHWNNIPISNQVVIAGILKSPENTYPYREWEKVESIEGGDYENTISKSWDIESSYARLESYFGNSGALSKDSGIEHVARSPKYQSKIKLFCDGTALLYGDRESKILSENSISIQVGTQENDISKLSIDVDGTFDYADKHGNIINIDGASGDMTIKPKNNIVIDADNSIKVGENAGESAILGDKLVTILENIIDAIKLITVSTGLGLSGTPINFAAFDSIKSQLNTIKSNLVKIE